MNRATTRFEANALLTLNADTINQRFDCQASSRVIDITWPDITWPDITWPVTCRGQTHTGNARSCCAIDVSAIVQRSLQGSLIDELNLDGNAELIQPSVKRIQ